MASAIGCGRSPAVEEAARGYPEKTTFTRFVPPARAEEMPGMWKAYYEKWPVMVTAQLGLEMVDLVASLKALVHPARVLDKMIYTPWVNGNCTTLLKDGTDAVVLSCREADVCVLAAVLGAVGLDIVLKDAVCSEADDTHNASLELLGGRSRRRLRHLQR